MTQVPMHLASQTMTEIFRAMTDGSLNETLAALFHETKLDTPSSVDFRVCIMRLLSGAIKEAEEARDAWSQQVKQLEFVEAQLKDLTLAIMAHDDTREVKGTIGKLCAQNNPEALHLEFPTHKPHVGNVIDPEHIERFNIPEIYLKKFAAFQIDAAKLKEDLKAGVKFEWASLTRGQQLRIRP